MGTNNNDKNVKLVGDSRVPQNRMRNIPKDYSEFPGRTEPFWPNYLLKEWMVGAVVLIGFLILTVSHEPPLETLADPTETGYNPVPDWYFLFLFQLLKYTYASSQYTVVGAVIIPGLAFGALMLAPWLDRGPERRPYRRPIATGLMLLAVVSLFYLTYEAYADHDWTQGERYAWDFEVEVDQEAEGYQIYADEQIAGCISCHGEQLEGAGPAGPPLFEVGAERTEDEIRDIIINGIGEMPAGMFEGSDEELDILVEWMATLGTEEAGDAGATEETADETDEQE